MIKLFLLLASIGKLLMLVPWKKYEIADLESAGVSSTVTRDRIRIAVIDDEIPAFIDALKRSGFTNIVHLTDIQSINEVQMYDIILSDIRGVGRKFSERFEGSIVIREIKKIYPGKVVIAYSGSKGSTLFNNHTRAADYWIDRDTENSDWISLLDECAKTCSNAFYQWSVTRGALLKERVIVKSCGCS